MSLYGRVGLASPNTHIRASSLSPAPRAERVISARHASQAPGRVISGPRHGSLRPTSFGRPRPRAERVVSARRISQAPGRVASRPEAKGELVASRLSRSPWSRGEYSQPPTRAHPTVDSIELPWAFWRLTLLIRQTSQECPVLVREPYKAFAQFAPPRTLWAPMASICATTGAPAAVSGLLWPPCRAATGMRRCAVVDGAAICSTLHPPAVGEVS